MFRFCLLLNKKISLFEFDGRLSNYHKLYLSGLLVLQPSLCLDIDQGQTTEHLDEGTCQASVGERLTVSGERVNGKVKSENYPPPATDRD